MQIDRIALAFAADGRWKTCKDTTPPFPPGQWADGATDEEKQASKEAFWQDIASLLVLHKGKIDNSIKSEIAYQADDILSYFMKLAACSSEVRPKTYLLLRLALRIASIVSRHFKLKYMRARPSQVLPWIVTFVPTPRHPSYPSGHSLQAHLMAAVLAEVAPALESRAMILAGRIARNREIAGVHFPRDSEESKEIAGPVWKKMKDIADVSDELTKLIDAASREHSGVNEDIPDEIDAWIESESEKNAQAATDAQEQRDKESRSAGNG